MGLLMGLAVSGTRVHSEPAVWRTEADLALTRTYMQAVALQNGNVLLEGGLDRESSEVVRAQSEIFDPRTGRSTLVTAPGGGRLWQTLTTLNDGRVLSVGGVSKGQRDWSAQAVAAMFDPLSARYVGVRQPVFARSDHGAALLPDGRVLVAGGHDGPKFVRAAEIYDPATDRWSVAPPMPHGRSQFSMAALPDGRVLLAGGFLEPGDPTDTSAIFDPRTGRWSDGPRLSVARAIHTTVRLASGDLLLAGGQRGAAGTAERFDARAGEFVFAGTLVAPRMFAAAAQAEDGSVILAGGFLRPFSGEGFIPTALAERWDPETNQWTVLPPVHTARAAADLVTAAGGLWLFGGSREDDHALRSVELLR